MWAGKPALGASADFHRLFLLWLISATNYQRACKIPGLLKISCVAGEIDLWCTLVAGLRVWMDSRATGSPWHAFSWGNRASDQRFRKIALASVRREEASREAGAGQKLSGIGMQEKYGLRRYWSNSWLTRCGGLGGGSTQEVSLGFGFGGQGGLWHHSLREGTQRAGDVWEDADSLTHLNLLVLALHPSEAVQEAASSPCLSPDLEWRLRLENYLHSNGTRSFVSVWGYRGT